MSFQRGPWSAGLIRVGHSIGSEMDTIDSYAQRKCALCGTDLEPHDDTCSSCGAGILPPPAATETRYAVPHVDDDDAPSRWPIILSVLGIVGALIVIGLAVRPFFDNRNDTIAIVKDPDTSPSTLAPAVETTPALVPDTTVAATVPAVVVAPPGPVVPALVEASCTARGSTDSQGNPISFRPENTIDGDLTTTWRCEGDAAGQTINYALAVPANVARVGMVPGYSKIDEFNGDDRFIENRRVTSAVWHCLDVAGVEVATATQTLADAPEMQLLDVAGFVACQVVRLEVTGATPPGRRDFTAISEVNVIAA